MHDAIAQIRSVIEQYYALLTQKVPTNWEPAPQYDTLRPYADACIVDRDRLRLALEQGDPPNESRDRKGQSGGGRVTKPAKT
jgi:hypothetical protein